MTINPFDDPADESPALRGEVKWFDVKKGFGFILAPDGRDVFVHFSSIVGDGFRSLKDGETVEYELTEGDKGLHARNVRRPNTGTVSPPPPVAHRPMGRQMAAQSNRDRA